MAAATTTFTVEYPRRQAMLMLYDMTYSFEKKEGVRVPTGVEVPVFVWPIPTLDGKFIVEHQDGHCQKVQPYELTFLGSKELFEQCSWEEE